jgi:hypothetical protein
VQQKLVAGLRHGKNKADCLRKVCCPLRTPQNNSKRDGVQTRNQQTIEDLKQTRNWQITANPYADISAILNYYAAFFKKAKYLFRGVLGIIRVAGGGAIAPLSQPVAHGAHLGFKVRHGSLCLQYVARGMAVHEWLWARGPQCRLGTKMISFEIAVRMRHTGGLTHNLSYVGLARAGRVDFNFPS